MSKPISASREHRKRDNHKGFVVYVNKEQSSFGSALDSLIDFRIRGDCDT